MIKIMMASSALNPISVKNPNDIFAVSPIESDPTRVAIPEVSCTCNVMQNLNRLIGTTVKRDTAINPLI